MKSLELGDVLVCRLREGSTDNSLGRRPEEIGPVVRVSSRLCISSLSPSIELIVEQR